jgi:uncharacterized damage-inducible protein DinB
MLVKEQLLLMSDYNTWMNTNLYNAVETLSSAEFFEDRKAFFGSVCGTLNHIAVADTIWLKRFAAHFDNCLALESVRELTMPPALDHILFTEFSSLKAYRVFLDEIITRWVASLAEEDLDSLLVYTNKKGVASRKMLGKVLLHFFNHQTHHRGQLTTLLSQFNCDSGVTDLLMLIPNEALPD